MALTLAAKAPTAVYRFSWVVPVVEGDSVASATLTVSSGAATIPSYEVEGNSVSFILTGGTAGETTVIAASAVTADGETIIETIYVPIVATTAKGETVADLCSFALRKVMGAGVTPTATMQADAIERLTDMLQHWRVSGADVGATFPLTSATVLYCTDAHLSAIKNNLIMQVADLYNLEISRMVAANALRGLQLVKQGNLSEDRGGGVYF